MSSVTPEEVSAIDILGDSGWHRVLLKNGDCYFIHPDSKISQWECPPEARESFEVLIKLQNSGAYDIPEAEIEYQKDLQVLIQDEEDRIYEEIEAEKQLKMMKEQEILEQESAELSRKSEHLKKITQSLSEELEFLRKDLLHCGPSAIPRLYNENLPVVLHSEAFKSVHSGDIPKQQIFEEACHLLLERSKLDRSNSLNKSQVTSELNKLVKMKMIDLNIIRKEDEDISQCIDIIEQSLKKNKKRAIQELWDRLAEHDQSEVAKTLLKSSKNILLKK